MSTSRVIEDVAARAGCPCERSAVGEANVADRMIARGAVFGGEGNGGVIDPRVGYVRDPFIGMSLVLELIATRQQAVSVLAAELPRYFIHKTKAPVSPERLPTVFDELIHRWPEAQVNRDDGLRLDWPDRWVHIRASNTEPIVRVIAEAASEEVAAALCKETQTIISS
jgi:phosphomannomutase